jgi:phospholipase/carboxylesterase
MPLRFIEQPPRQPGLDRTIVLLHGYGANEEDLLPIGEALDPRLRVVSLQAPLSLGGSMRAWFHLAQDARGGIRFEPKQVNESVQAALEAVEQVAQTSPRPVLLGFSQGAAMALGVALRKPELTAGVLSLSGVPPPLDAAAPEAGLKGFPVFAAHGTLDPLLPIALGRATRDALVRLGLAVEWHEYEMSHMVLPEEISDARAWLKGRLDGR